MISYLIESSISMIVLIGVYHLFLEREKMHKFNRYFLLFSLVFSLSVPFINIKISYPVVSKVNLSNLPGQITVREAQSLAPTPANIQTKTKKTQVEIKRTQTDAKNPARSSEIPFFLIGYLLITSALLIRFIYNLTTIILEIYENPHVPTGYYTLVLLDDCRIPHSFFKYIFVNRQAYQSTGIDGNILKHEKAHIQQVHTMDILFIEMLKTLFWFNPLFYLYKKAIQDNHEYLADEAVAMDTNDIKDYQRLLLSMHSDGMKAQLTSGIQFSITKKRIKMMTKKSTRLCKIWKKISIVPVLACLFIVCGAGTKKSEAVNSMLGQQVKQSSSVPIDTQKNSGDMLTIQSDTTWQKINNFNKLKTEYYRKLLDYMNIEATKSNRQKLENSYRKLTDMKNKGWSLYKKISGKKSKDLRPPMVFIPNPKDRIRVHKSYFFQPPAPFKIDTTYYTQVVKDLSNKMKEYSSIVPTLENKKKLKHIYLKMLKFHERGVRLFLELKLKKDKNKIKPLGPLIMRPNSRIMVYYRQHPKLAINNNTILKMAYKNYIRGLKEYRNTLPSKGNATTLGIMYAQTKTYYNNWKGIFEKSNTNLVLPSLPEIAWKRIKAYEDSLKQAKSK